MPLIRAGFFRGARLSSIQMITSPLVSAPNQVVVVFIFVLVVALLLFGIYWHIMRIAKWAFSSYDVIFESNSSNTILTIDDVPFSEKSTQQILDALYENNCTATLFINNNLLRTESYKQLLIKAVRQGNHLGNHGEKHRAHFWLSEAELLTELHNCQILIDNIYDIAGIPRPSIKYFRPTYGLVTHRIHAFCQKHAYKIVLGTNFPSDPRVKIPALNQFYIERHYCPNDVIILHDRPWTPALLKNLLVKVKTQSLFESHQ